MNACLLKSSFVELPQIARTGYDKKKFRYGY